MTTDLLIRFDKLKKKYGGVTVLSVESVVLRHGDRVVISGENGSGKSTLLKMLAGLANISEGDEVRTKHWKELSVGFLPQDGGIYRDLTVRENLAVVQRMLGASVDYERSADLATRFGLASLLDKRVEALSGGFRRLAALFCLLCSGADLLFIDEPFASIDPTKQKYIEDTLAELASKFQLVVKTAHSAAVNLNDQSFWQKHIKLGADDHARDVQT